MREKKKKKGNSIVWEHRVIGLLIMLRIAYANMILLQIKLWLFRLPSLIMTYFEREGKVLYTTISWL